MNKADFIIIGAAKSGTTTLCDRLGEHPEIFVSTPKEPKFFSIDDNYKKGVAEYEKIFIGSDKEKVRGCCKNSCIQSRYSFNLFG